MAEPQPPSQRAAAARAVRLAAQGARPTTSSATCARRWPASAARPSARGTRAARGARRMRTGDTPADERRALVKRPAGHPGHHAGVALPDAHLAGARGAARRRARDRRRDPRPRRHQARRAPGALARAAGGADANAAAADRPVGDAAAAGGGRRASCGGAAPRRASRDRSSIVDAGVRKPLELEVVVPVEDMARLGEALPPDEQPGGPAAGPEARSSIWPSIHPRLLELIRAHRSHAGLRQLAAAWPSGWPPASTSWPARSWSGPTTARSPASSGSRSRRC